MPIALHEIEKMLRDAFPKADISVVDTVGDQNHYAVKIIDAQFKGQSRIAQQRSVYNALQGKMDGENGELHAIQISTAVPPDVGSDG